MHFIALTSDQAELAAYRFRVHDNSATRIAHHFGVAGDQPSLRLCRVIRRLERDFEIDLGAVCHKFLEKDDGCAPDVQRQVMEYVAYWKEFGNGERDLIISIDRVRQIGRLAKGDPEWVSSRGS